jgi:Epoxide hydrolase N terminus
VQARPERRLSLLLTADVWQWCLCGEAGVAGCSTVHVDIPEEELAELRRRIAEARWPSKELVADRSQGVQLATLRELTRYWETDYDWRKAEAKLNALRNSRPRSMVSTSTSST